MDIAPRRLWHASRADIDRPTLAGRTVGDHHDNSGLGLFCAAAPHDYIGGFGPFIHELHLVPNARVLRITLQEFAALSRQGDDRAWFEEEGRRLARDYDLIEIEEITGSVDQAIVLRDDAVANSRKLTLQEYAQFSIPHGAPKAARPKA